MKKLVIGSLWVVTIFMFCNYLMYGSVCHAQDKGPLTIAVYGGEWGTSISNSMFKPFEEKFGVKIVPEPGVSQVTLSKLRQQKENPLIDVAWMDSGISELALNEGLIEPIDAKKIPNLENIFKEAVYRNNIGEIFAVGGGYIAVGITFNSEKVKNKPTSWLDLWKKEYVGRVTAPSPGNAAGVPFLVLISELKGGGIDNVAPGLDALKKLDVAAYYDTAGGATNMFQSGEVIIGAHYSSSAWYMFDRKLPIGFVVPKEGVNAQDIRMHIIKGTKHRDLAEKFINLAVSAEAQKALAELLYVAPVNKGVILSQKARDRMPYGPTGSIANLRFADWQAINAKRAQLTELWNREVGRK